MRFPLTEDERDALAREIHGMFHAGATEYAALERMKTRLSRGRYDELSPIFRVTFDRLILRVFRPLWGEQACGPDHEVPICDLPAKP